jgi:hypothetical protein
MSQARNQHEADSNQSVDFHRTTRRDIPEDETLYRPTILEFRVQISSLQEYRSNKEDGGVAIVISKGWSEDFPLSSHQVTKTYGK